MSKSRTVILGIDMAWGNRMPDAVARIDCFGAGLHEKVVGSCVYLKGDMDLLDCVAVIQKESGIEQMVLAIDAPTLCVNETSSRPVDKECNRLFRRYEAGCHPVNKKLCARPLRVAEKLKKIGFEMTSNLHSSPYIAMEVYPHPAMIRWFGLEKTIKYKKGKVDQRRFEFARYQSYFQKFLQRLNINFTQSDDLQELLNTKWDKEAEDKLDAYFCTVIGLWHLMYAGEKTQILGDHESGEMIIPMGFD